MQENLEKTPLKSLVDFDPKTQISTTPWTFSFTYTYEKITYTQACKQGTLSNFCQECTAGGKNQKNKKLCAILVCVLSVVHDKLLFVVVSERN